MHRFAGVMAVLLFMASSLLCQETPTDETVKAAVDKFRTERADAAKAFPAAELANADEQSLRADVALKEGQLVVAARLIRDARWAVPLQLSNLPPHVSRVMGVSRLRHGDRVTGVSFSPDGTKLASSSRDGTVRIWDLGNGRELVTYRGHQENAESANERTNVLKVPNVVFSPDGSVVVASGERDIHVIDARTGDRKQILKGHTGAARGLAFATNAANTNTLISGGDDRHAIIWDIKTGKSVATFPNQSTRIEAVAVGEKGKLFATINAAGELYVYPLTGTVKPQLLGTTVTDAGEGGFGVAFVGDTNGILTGGGDNQVKLTMGPDAASTTPTNAVPVRTFTGHTGKITCLAASKDGKWFVSGSADRTVRVWDVSSGKTLWTFQGHAGATVEGREVGVTAVAISPDGKWVASGGVDGGIKLWPLTKEDEHRSFAEATDSVWAVATSPDGKRFASAGADRVVRIYNTSSYKLETALKGHKAAIPALVFVGNDHVATASGDKLVKLWDVANGTAKDLVGHASAVLAITADASGKFVVSGSVDKSVKAWDETGKPLWTWTGKSAVCALAVRQDGQRIAVGTADGTLTILTTNGVEPKVTGSVPAHGGGVACVSFHPDGSRVISCGGDGVTRIWAVTEAGPVTLVGKLEPTVQSGGPNTIAPLSSVVYSHNGKLIATAGADGVTHVWDAQSLAEIRGFRAHTNWVTAVTFTPDDNAILSASVDKTVRSFELTRQNSSTAVTHTGPIQCVAVSRDGQLVATGSNDKSVKIWTLATGQLLTTLAGSTDTVNAVSFGAKNELVSAGDDQKLRWWSIETGRELRSVKAGGTIFNIAQKDGNWAVVWNRDREKFTSFEQFTNDGKALTAVNDSGREISCAILSADATLGIAGGDDGVARIWNLQTKDRVGGDWPISTHKLVDLAVTTDNKMLITIDSRGDVKVADIAKRAAGETIHAVKGTVAGLVVSPTNDKFATLAVEGDVKAWSLTGQELRTWKLNTSPATAVFTPDGKKLIVGNKDGSVFVLDLP